MTRKFQGIWIPKEIWLNKDLPLIEKLFIVEINSLDNKDGCFASNKYFADFFGVSKSRVSQIISNLVKKKMIKIDLIYNGKVVEKRVVRILKGVFNKLTEGSKFSNQGYLENCEVNSTLISNTDNSTDSHQEVCDLEETNPLKKLKENPIQFEQGFLMKFSRLKNLEKKLEDCSVAIMTNDNTQNWSNWKYSTLSARFNKYLSSCLQSQNYKPQKSFSTQSSDEF